MSDLFQTTAFQSLLAELAGFPCDDNISNWPNSQLKAMAAAGVMGWDVPRGWGGTDLSQADHLEGLRQLASACLASTFVLTQRSAAVRRVATSANISAQERLLPPLLRGEIFATVGISHLTTSGQHLKTPLVQAVETDDGFELNGITPWATGATQADFLITGGTLADGRQILAAIPTDRSGMEVRPPVKLMALNASQTGAVDLRNVCVSQNELLHGPVEAVMQQGTGGGAGSLGTSALALGTTYGMLQKLRRETAQRSDLLEFSDALQQECDELTGGLRVEGGAAGLACDS